jgi:aminomethyltransferase
MSEADGKSRMSEATETERAVPADYGDARAEYDAVREGGAGLFDLSARGRLELSGAEAVQFFNGMVTNDVARLADGAWMAAALPNPQGRLLASMRVARLGETFFIDTEPETAQRVRQSLDRFTLAGDFHVRDLSPETRLLSVQGAGARRVVGAGVGAQAAAVEPGRAAYTTWDGARVLVLRATHTAEDGYDLVCDTGDAERLWGSLRAAGALPVGRAALEVLRIEAGVARYGVDGDDTNVVLEVAPAEAVSFTKGCYTGQEIIARIHWRGHVAKRLVGLLLEGAERAAPGSKIVAGEEAREVGRVTSSAHSPRLGRAVALGIVKYDFLAPGTELRVVAEDGAARAARVAELPLVGGSWRAGAEAAEGA